MILELKVPTESKKKVSRVQTVWEFLFGAIKRRTAGDKMSQS